MKKKMIILIPYGYRVGALCLAILCWIQVSLLLPTASGLSAIEQLEPVRSYKEEEALFKMYPRTVPIFDVRIGR